jgi:glycosyltransferase involved in cell wall biosynthesis
LSKNKAPKISVLVCAHNEEKYIRESIGSILIEKNISLEVIVVEDRSVDRTPEMLNSMSLLDNRIKLITRVDSLELECPSENKYFYPIKGHGGQVDPLNLGLKFCSGEYIARLDADDISLPGRFTAQYNFMNANKDVDFLASSAVRIDSSGRFIGDYHSQPLSSNEIVQRIRSLKPYAAHSTWFVRKTLYDRLGGYDSDYDLTEDLDFMLRASELEDIKFAFLPDPQIKLRMQLDSLSGSASVKPAHYAITALVAHNVRLQGHYVNEETKRRILRKVTEVSPNYNLERKASSYYYLKNAYICFKSHSYIDGMLSLAKSFFYDPNIFFNYKEFSNIKSSICEIVTKSILLDGLANKAEK